MDQSEFERWEARVEVATRDFAYPPTPDIAGSVARRLAVGPAPRPAPRRAAWALALLLVLLGGLLVVPPVRAALLDVLRIGAVRIFFEGGSPAPASSAPIVSPDYRDNATGAAPRLAPAPTVALLDLTGETTVTGARTAVDFPIRLPAFPPELGAPDHVFVQTLGAGRAVVLVWLDPAAPDRVALSLHILGPGTIVDKVAPELLEETTVNGERALWVEGPHLVETRSRGMDIRRLVEGRVLIWTKGDLTYRIETTLPLEDAVRIAESLE